MSSFKAIKLLPTMREARDHLIKLAGQPERWSATQPDSAFKVAQPEEDRTRLVPQPVWKSSCQFTIPVKSDLEVREKYVNFHGHVRVGKLLEDLDYGAVLAGYLHNERESVEQTFSMSLVTAAVDQMFIHRPDTVPDDGDLQLNAHVTWVGNSSIEVTETVSQNDSPILNAKFLIVARHAKDDRAVPVNGIQIETNEEREAFEDGEKSKQLRKVNAQSSLLNSPPNSEESVLIHEIFKNSIDISQRTFKRQHKTDSEMWMEDAILKSSTLWFPEHRNLYNKIFGGHIMRKSFEHSWSNALEFTKLTDAIVTPIFIDDISFRRPVSIGDLFFMSSQVTYTQDNYMVLRCHAEVRNVNSVIRETTNEFYFVFSALDRNRAPVAAPKVKPKSYAEYILYLDGRRRFQTFIKCLQTVNRGSAKL